MARSYVQKSRARTREETRRRIVEAAAALHESVGPRNTSISAVAEKAHVQRLTVYRHFPTETELFHACISGWLAENPPPDPAKWSHIQGLDRVRVALAALYAYYRGTWQMWTMAHRDEAEVPALHGPMSAFRDTLGGIVDGLVDGLEADEAVRAQARATLSHAVRFPTWLSLAETGLDAVDMADLVRGWLKGIGVR